MFQSLSRIKNSLPVTGLIFVTACQTAQPIAEITTAIATDPAVKNGDVLAMRRSAGEDIPELRGTHLVTIRAYHFVSSKKSSRPKAKEFTGASCTVESDGFTGKVTAPGQIRVPDYGYASRLITAKCTAEGYKPGFASTTAYDLDKSSRRVAAASGGLIGIVVGEVINAADDKRNNKYVYREAKVYLNRIGCENTKHGCRSR